MEKEALSFAPINGTEIAYRFYPKAGAETIVMTHAGLCNQDMWQGQVSHFAKYYQVLTWDMRGFGQSKMVKGAFAHDEDILALMDVLNIQEAWFIACSMGGNVALELTITKPERVKGLLLIAPALGGYQYTGTPHPLMEAIEKAEEAGDIELLSELEVQLWVDGMGRSAADIDPLMRKAVWEMNLIPLSVDAALWEEEKDFEPPVIERLESIEKPILLVIGDLDIPSCLERADILEKRLPQTQKVVMRGTAHLPNMEQPEVFNKIVDEFLVKQ